ncbi:MAG TPA: DUF882 domain-containing protein, partial [Steroidobacteraceae bacterium]
MISRRRMLMATAALAGAAALGTRSSIGAPNSNPKRIALLNLHSGERLDIEYGRDDAYAGDALTAIGVLLRDFRNGEKHAIDPHLMDYLVDVAARLGVPPAYSVISGYRSPETTGRLHERSGGVSQHSLHMQGRAIDVRIGGVDCADLAARAEDLKRGGVG